MHSGAKSNSGCQKFQCTLCHVSNSWIVFLELLVGLCKCIARSTSRHCFADARHAGAVEQTQLNCSATRRMRDMHDYRQMLHSAALMRTRRGSRGRLVGSHVTLQTAQGPPSVTTLPSSLLQVGLWLGAALLGVLGRLAGLTGWCSLSASMGSMALSWGRGVGPSGNPDGCLRDANTAVDV